MTTKYKVTITGPLGTKSTLVYDDPDEIDKVVKSAYENGCGISVIPIEDDQ